MSKTSNMLRMRRKDNNVKPNRRLDRKSSRGMLYENEELRLKTININAEVERGQSDIKKLKRENDQLRREIWYLRDEYDKLDKLLRDKESGNSSSSTTCSSDSESGTSYTEESGEVEMSQNLENVQKTKLQDDFDHLSIVPEENSAENSEKLSNDKETSAPHVNWESDIEKHIIKADQSYPAYQNLPTLPMQDKSPKHFFSPITPTKSYEKMGNNQFLSTDTSSTSQTTCASQDNPFFARWCPELHGMLPNTSSTPQLQSFAQNGEEFDVGPDQFYKTPVNCFLPQPQYVYPIENKSSTDLIVKTDNQNFNTLSRSSFSNGGNLEELLNDIETISHDILKMSNPQSPPRSISEENTNYNYGFVPPLWLEASRHSPENDADIVAQLQHGTASYVPTTRIDNCEFVGNAGKPSQEKPYKSELNVVLMPNPMPLIGIEKYKNIQKSCESVNTKSLENMSASCQNLRILPPPTAQSIARSNPNMLFTPITPVPVPPICPSPLYAHPIQSTSEPNPFFGGNLIDVHDLFSKRYNPDNYQLPDAHQPLKIKNTDVFGSRTNLLDAGVSSEPISSENEENLRFTTSSVQEQDKTSASKDHDSSKPSSNIKLPKLSIRRKVSIHFKGKKDKSLKSASENSQQVDTKDSKTKTQDKKTPMFDKKSLNQQTPSTDSPKTPFTLEPKTPTGSASKTINKNSIAESKSSSSEQRSRPDQNPSKYDAKATDSNRKSSSGSPERRHIHGKSDGKKAHRKSKKLEKGTNRRMSMSTERLHRERSFSVCTDRSNILEHRSGLGYSMYDEYLTSDRERTNSLSSCECDTKARKMSNISNIPTTGKIPWCGCWGNGCL